MSLNLRTYLRLEATSTGTVCVNLPNIDTFLHWDLSELKQFTATVTGKGQHTLVYPVRPSRLLIWLLCPVIMGTGRTDEVKLLDPDLVRRLREYVGVTNGNLNTSQMATLSFLYLYLSVFGSG